MLEMTTTHGNQYVLTDDGKVVARSNGPEGWDYSGQWIILGAAKRSHSRRVLSLDSILSGEDFGQGWVHDLDHGTYRLWGGERLQTLRRISAEGAGWSVPVAGSLVPCAFTDNSKEN